MTPVTEAAALILEAMPLLSAEWIPFTAAQGRILATDLCTDQDFPAAPTSSMDGYAVRAADVQQVPQILQVVETVPAGAIPLQVLGEHDATRLYTGSLLPTGADTIVIQEVTERLSPDQVQIQQAPQVGQFVRPQGSYGQRGERVLTAGTILGAAEIAVLASLRRLNLPVYRQPRVAILSTGTELVLPEQVPRPGQIIDSNRYALAAAVTQAGGIPIDMGAVPDDLVETRQAMAAALASADVVISSGGVSVGDFDFVETLLADLGGDIRLRAVAIKPGKPLTFAVFPGGRCYFGLPGNPVSALVTFWRFVQPALRRLQGHTGDLRWCQAQTTSPLRGEKRRESYLWGHLGAGIPATFIPARDHNSGNFLSLAGCRALARVPIGTENLAQGSLVDVLWLD